jgi:hypothetical protein
VKNQKYESVGGLDVKIHVLFYGDNSRTILLTQMRFGVVKDHGRILKFHLNFILFDKVLNMAAVRTLKLCWDKRGTILCKIP